MNIPITYNFCLLPFPIHNAILTSSQSSSDPTVFIDLMTCSPRASYPECPAFTPLPTDGWFEILGNCPT